MRVTIGVMVLATLIASGDAGDNQQCNGVQLHSRTRDQQQLHLRQRQSDHRLAQWLITNSVPLKSRGGGATEGLPPQAHWKTTLRGGGRTSDAVIFIEAAAETVLESACIVGWVGATEHLAKRYVSTRFLEVARLGIWTAAVFLSGVATAGPRKWLSSSQLLNIENPLSEDWYANIRKPSWTPPNWLFPVMWLPLKILQVFACYEMWDNLSVRRLTALPVVVYAVYKSLGDTWNKVFFERRRLRLATGIMSVYYLTLLAGIKLFFDVTERAGYLFAPTAAWVTVAACLQWSTWLLNQDHE